MNFSTGDIYKIRFSLAAPACFVFISLLFLPIIAVCATEEISIWRQDFENRLPGQTPEGWMRFSGKGLLEDILTTSNMEVLSGKRSLLAEHIEKSETGGYGLSRLTPSLSAGTVKMTIPFLLRGASAYGASFSVEIRSASQSPLTVLAISPGIAKCIPGWGAKTIPLGGIEFDAWHRFVIILPLDGGGKKVSTTLERRNKDGSWTSCGDSAESGVLNAIGKDRQLSIQFFIANTSSFQLYIDDLVIEPVPKESKP